MLYNMLFKKNTIVYTMEFLTDNIPVDTIKRDIHLFIDNIKTYGLYKLVKTDKYIYIRTSCVRKLYKTLIEHCTIKGIEYVSHAGGFPNGKPPKINTIKGVLYYIDNKENTSKLIGQLSKEFNLVQSILVTKNIYYKHIDNKLIIYFKGNNDA